MTRVSPSPLRANRIVLPLALASLGAALAGCSQGAASATQSAASPLPHIATIEARRRTLAPALREPGIIVPYQTIGVSSALSEPLLDVDVREGDVVRAGQVLAHLETDDLDASLASADQVVAQDRARALQFAYGANASFEQSSSDVRSANAALQQAAVNLASAQNDLQRDQTLADQGYLAAQTLEQQRTTVASDVQAVAAARATLRAARAADAANGTRSEGAEAAQLASAQAATSGAAASALQIRREIARATIVAPVDGTVVAVNANPGEYPSGRQLFTIERNDFVYAVLSATDSDAFSIRTGAAANVTPHGAPHAFSGRVVAVLDQVAPGSTNFTIKVLLANPDSTLHAGMPVRAVLAAPHATGIAVPNAAFVDDRRESDFVVNAGEVRERRVSVVADDGTTSIVTGLAPGSRVVSDVQSAGVADGDRVRD